MPRLLRTLSNAWGWPRSSLAMMADKKDRADKLLADAGLADSREQAKRLIMAGQAMMDRGGKKEPIQKPGQLLPVSAVLSLKERERFVSRGGFKLLTALEFFHIDVSQLICLDAGASTGGFTDCLLQHGAARVYAVDVGTHQLHEKLRSDPRVVSLEGVNLRHAPDDLVPEKVDLIVADCSFISLTLILPACLKFLRPGGQMIALVKPQFELGPEAVKKGVVRSQELQDQAVAKVIRFAEDELGLTCQGTVPAGIKGPKGNQEYLLLFFGEGPVRLF